jgi:ABC-2 type transport system permease protein
MGAVFFREIRSYFQTITGFIFLGLFLLFAGIIFAMSNLWPPGTSDFRSTLTFLNFIFLIGVPILTMRLLSEESRQKTDQLLLTSPTPLTAVVVGKYLAALALLTVALLITGIFPAMISTSGLVVGSELLCAYLGVFLLGASLISVGVFVSSLTDNQVSAALLTFGAILLIWAVDWVVQALPRDRVASLAFLLVLSVLAAVFVLLTTRNVWVALGVGVLALGGTLVAYALIPASFDGLMVHIVIWFSLVARYGNFSRGVLAVGPVLYYLSFTATFIFLTVRVIDRRRWA